MAECKNCGSKDNYNYAINNGFCDACIESELERLQSDLDAANKRIRKLKKAIKFALSCGMMTETVCKQFGQALKDE